MELHGLEIRSQLFHLPARVAWGNLLALSESGEGTMMAASQAPGSVLTLVHTLAPPLVIFLSEGT